MNSEEYLVTGATGFVGSCIVRELVNKNKRVSIISRSKKLNWRLHDLRSKITIYECDLLDVSLKNIILKVNPTYVFHLAAYGAVARENDEAQMIDTNIMGTLNLINALKKSRFRLMINTGSSSEYGVHEKRIKETMQLSPINLYGVTKSAQTLLCCQIAKKEKLPIVTLRLFSPYGPYEGLERLVPHITLNTIDNNAIKLSSPNFVRDFIYIDDVVNVFTNYLSSMTRFSGEIFNVGSGKQHSIQEVASTIIKMSKSESKIHWNKIPQQIRQIEPKKWEADISKAYILLRWKPRVSFNRGIKMNIDWFRENKKLYLG